MANSVLFKSSIAMAVLHVVGLLWSGCPNLLLATNVVAGVGTSIWNHGMTSFTAKVADRGMMWIGFFVDLHLVWSISHHPRCVLCIATLVAAGALYWIAKAWIAWSNNTRVVDLPKELKPQLTRQTRLGDLPHVCAHLSLTVTHLLLMEALAA